VAKQLGSCHVGYRHKAEDNPMHLWQPTVTHAVLGSRVVDTVHVSLL
jgi:hypothetical protein